MKQQRGMTIVELAVGLSLLSGLLLVLLSLTQSVSSSVNTNQRAHDAAEATRIALQRISPIVRRESASSVRVRTTPGGSWIVPAAGVTYPAMRLGVTEQIVLEWQVGDGETRDGADQDGDGLVDEGNLMLDGVVIAADVEICEFSLDGRLFELRLQCGRRDRSRVVHRFVHELRVTLRNG